MSETWNRYVGPRAAAIVLRLDYLFRLPARFVDQLWTNVDQLRANFAEGKSLKVLHPRCISFPTLRFRDADGEFKNRRFRTIRVQSTTYGTRDLMTEHQEVGPLYPYIYKVNSAAPSCPITSL